MIQVYCDGSSSGKSNKPGGWAYIVIKNGHVLSLNYGGHPRTTNNVMELEAAIKGIESAVRFKKSSNEPIVLISDSMYVLNMAAGNATPYKNVEIVERLKNLFQLHCSDVEWVKGHSGHPINERCDKMAKQGKKEIVAEEEYFCAT
jgi:ribonuclease HI